MRKSIPLVFFCLFFASTLTYAENNESLCQAVSKGDEGVKELPADFIRLRDTWRFFGAKKNWAEPQTIEIKMDSKTEIDKNKSEVKHFSQFKNYILALTENLDSPEQLNLLNQYTEDMIQLERMEKKLKKIFFTKEFGRCMRKAKSLNFSYTNYTLLLEKLRPYNQLRSLLFSRQIKYAIEKITPTLRLRYEINIKSNWQQIFKILMSPDTANVILILPSTESGRLIALDDVFLPTHFFERMGPALFSLALYTEKWALTESTYQLKHYLKKTPSFFPKRFFLTPKKMAFEGNETLRPYQGLDHFISSSDRYVHKAFREIREVKIPLISTEMAKCSFHFQGLEVLKGNFGLELNNHFLYPLTSQEKIEILPFPCEFLTGKDNRLLVHRAETKGNHPAQLINSDYSAELVKNGETPLPPSIFKHQIKKNPELRSAPFYEEGLFIYK